MRYNSSMNRLPSIVTWLDQLSPSERQLIAHLWQLAPQQSLAALIEPATIQAMWQRLDDAQRAAIQRVLEHDGMIPVGVLEREFGTIRTHAGFVNPRAYLHALSGVPSVVEKLYVLGMIQRLRSDDGLMYAIPQELIEHLPKPEPHNPTPHFDHAEPPEIVFERDPSVIERDLVTLLALAYREPLLLTSGGALHRTAVQRLAQRLNQQHTSEARWQYAAFLRMIALDLELLAERNGALRVTATALDWLDLPMFDRVSSMLAAWLESRFDELTSIAELRWRTQPLQRPARAARRAVLEVLAQTETWLTIESLVGEMQRTQPEFARSNADFEAWQITDSAGNSLRGWHNWRKVEGALIHAMLSAPLFWLGLIDLAGDDVPTHVRLNAWGRAMLSDAEPPEVQHDGLRISRDGRMSIAPRVAPLVRFQAQRFAIWQRTDVRGIEQHLITLRSFDEANERGISRDQIERFLERSCQTVPQPLMQTLRDWEQRRRALRGRMAMLLTADDPALLATITDDLQHDLPDHQRLNEQTWAFEIADAEHVVATLRDHGFGLISTLETPDTDLSERDVQALLRAAIVVQSSYEDHGISAALLERVRRLLPTAERVEAQRQADELLKKQKAEG